MKNYFNRFKSTGVCPPRKSISNVMWSWIGVFLGILLVSVMQRYFFKSMGTQDLFLIGSFGTSAVLIYGAPLAEYSQPRNLIGGHMFSAIIGVSIYMLFGDQAIFVAPLAVSCATITMHFTRTLHPPGGATALIAIIGGDNIHSLGYMYVLFPVVLGSILMLFVALLVNNISNNPKRHYPVYWI
jgi:CBS domain-containing membrane protein